MSVGASTPSPTPDIDNEATITANEFARPTPSRPEPRQRNPRTPPAACWPRGARDSGRATSALSIETVTVAFLLVRIYQTRVQLRSTLQPQQST